MAESYKKSIFIVICLFHRCLLTVAREVSLSFLLVNIFFIKKICALLEFKNLGEVTKFLSRCARDLILVFSPLTFTFYYIDLLLPHISHIYGTDLTIVFGTFSNDLIIIVERYQQPRNPSSIHYAYMHYVMQYVVD